jgi:hypothetical protein
MDALPNCIALDIQFHTYAGFKYTSIHLIRPIVSSNLALIQCLNIVSFTLRLTFKFQILEKCQHL